MTDVLDKLIESVQSEANQPDIKEFIAQEFIAHKDNSSSDESDGILSEEEHEDSRSRARFTSTPSITLIYGPPGRGKSYLLRKMYEEPPDNVNGVLVFTPTPTDWKDIKKCCIRDWNESVLAALMLHQKNNGASNHIVIILDDLLSKVNYDTKLMIELFTRHRHYNLSVIIAAQNITKTIHPMIRGQVSRFICFDPPSLESCKILYEAFCSSIWKSARVMYKDMKTKDMMSTHSYLVINVNSGEYYINSG